MLKMLISHYISTLCLYMCAAVAFLIVLLSLLLCHFPSYPVASLSVTAVKFKSLQAVKMNLVL